MNIHKIINTLFVFVVALGFTSCIEDDWFDDYWWDRGGWQDEIRVESALRGRWFVDVVDAYDDGCPYFRDDEFKFYRNGKVEIIGGDQLYHQGVWWVDGRYLLIDFSGDDYADWEAYIENLTPGFLSLKVEDIDLRSRYYLELSR